MDQHQQTSSKFRILGDFSNLSIGACVEIARDPWPFFDVTGREIVLGNYVVISSGVYIHTHSHQFNKSNWRKLPKIIDDEQTIICDYAFIGVNAQIMPSCKYIGLHSVVAAGAVVTKDIPDYEIWAGNPAFKIGDVEKGD